MICEMEQQLNNFANTVDKNVYCYVPIKNLWKDITEHIINSLIVIDRKARLLYTVYLCKFTNPYNNKY